MEENIACGIFGSQARNKAGCVDSEGNVDAFTKYTIIDCTVSENVAKNHLSARKAFTKNTIIQLYKLFTSRCIQISSRVLSAVKTISQKSK